MIILDSLLSPTTRGMYSRTSGREVSSITSYYLSPFSIFLLPCPCRTQPTSLLSSPPACVVTQNMPPCTRSAAPTPSSCSEATRITLLLMEGFRVVCVWPEVSGINFSYYAGRTSFDRQCHRFWSLTTYCMHEGRWWPGRGKISGYLGKHPGFGRPLYQTADDGVWY